MKNIKDYAPLCLRMAIGIGFMVHGWAKISRGTGGFEKLLTQTGVPFAHNGYSAYHYHAGGYVWRAYEIWVQFCKYNWFNSRWTKIRSPRL
jgi:uncharacterized membrane protein YphA (DoxX/SURF4 family)